MTFSSTLQDRAQIDASIHEAHEMRAAYLAAAVRSVVRWFAGALEPVKLHLTRESTGGLGHTFKDEVLP